MMRYPILLLLANCLLLSAQPDTDYQLSPQEFFDRADVQEPIDTQNFNPQLLASAVFHASNQIRLARHREVFEFSHSLKQAADQHARYLRQNASLVHLNEKYEHMRTPALRIENAGGTFEAVSENLARLNLLKLGENGQFFVEENGKLINARGEELIVLSYAELANKVVSGWMGSKGHRANLLGDYSYLGVGISSPAQSKDGLPEVYFVQNFGKR